MLVQIGQNMYHDMDFETKPNLVVPFEHTFLGMSYKKYQICELLHRHLKQLQDKFDLKTQNIFRDKNQKRNGKNSISVGLGDNNTA
jgi:hypothetical protein